MANKNNILKEIELKRRRIIDKKNSDKKMITVCGGTGCQAYNCKEVIGRFKEIIKQKGLKSIVDLKVTGCHGFCERGPIVVIHPGGIFYQRIKPENAEEIVEETVINGKIIENFLYVEPLTHSRIPKEKDVTFYKKQKRLIFGNNGLIDPTNIEDYLAIGGYKSLIKVLTQMTPEQVINEIKKSGLRGRGGAGFPTGRKWEVCKKAPGFEKYIICNCDEGDPGAYMDRSLLEGNPHSVLEGMIIGAYAIGANQGYIYVRKEYPLAVKNISQALEQALKWNFIGENILGRSFNFNVDIVQGAGAFVSGEETAMIASIEGRRAFPTPRPPYPAQKGLWGKPTNINNVETWANVPLIISKGAKWYSQIGTEKSKGTKIFSLVGKINNTGLVEVPMGITLREIIFEIGGGIPKGKKFKAVQTGGPSGGCIPEELLDLPIDFESLTEAGSMMGSGGMIVMDEDTCMVDVARYFLNFTQHESCGKCVPCRVGTRQMVEILNRIVKGEGEEGDLQKLEELAQTVKNTSLCGLGQTAPNPVLSTIRYFRNEYEAHILEKKCPAKVCTDLIAYYILPEKCVGCLLCLKNCPVEAISGERKKVHIINQEKCIKCGMCYEVCPPKVSAVVKLASKKELEEIKNKKNKERDS